MGLKARSYLTERGGRTGAGALIGPGEITGRGPLMGVGCFMGPGRLKGARFVIGFPKLKNGTTILPSSR